MRVCCAFVVLLLAPLVAHATALLAPSCGTVSVNGAQVDLNTIPAGSFNADQMYMGKTSPYVWGFSLCTAASSTSINPSATQSCPDDPIFAGQWSTSGSSCQGGYNTMTSAPTVANNIVTFNYAVNCPTCRFTSYVAVVNVQCGSSASLTPIGNVDVTGAFPSLTYTFNLGVSTVCGGAPPPPPPPPPTNAPPQPPGPPSPTNAPPQPPGPPGPNGPAPSAEEKPNPGAIAFLCIVFVGGFIYVVAVMVFNFVKGKRGLELAPHPEFWKDVPLLIADGCKFVFNSARGLCNKGGSGDGAGYAKI